MKKYSEDSLQDEIGQCTVLIIQNLQKTISHNMFNSYLKQRGQQLMVERFIINGQRGFIRVLFSNHQKAMKFYDEENFITRLLIRPFNIYLDLKIEEHQFTKYFLRKVTQKNIRQVFEECRKYGIVKLNTRYSKDNRHMLDTVVLSYLKYHSQIDNLMQPLAEVLEKLNVSIEPYISGNNSKIYIKPPPEYVGPPIKPPKFYPFVPPPPYQGPLPNIPPSIYNKNNVNIPPPKFVSNNDSEQDKEDSEIQNFSIIYYISIYQQNSQQAKMTEQQLKDQMKKKIKREKSHICVRTKVLPTLDGNLKNIVQIRQVSIEDYDQAIRVSSLLVEEIRANLERSIVYHYTSQNEYASILNIFQPNSFVVKATEEKCVILIAGEQSKSIKLAEFSFCQQAYFWYQKAKMTFKFIEAQDIKVYGDRQLEVQQQDLYLKQADE